MAPLLAYTRSSSLELPATFDRAQPQCVRMITGCCSCFARRAALGQTDSCDPCETFGAFGAQFGCYSAGDSLPLESKSRIGLPAGLDTMRIGHSRPLRSSFDDVDQLAVHDLGNFVASRHVILTLLNSSHPVCIQIGAVG